MQAAGAPLEREGGRRLDHVESRDARRRDSKGDSVQVSVRIIVLAAALVLAMAPMYIATQEAEHGHDTEFTYGW